MQDQQAEQLKLFYTHEEVEAKIKEALTGAYTAEDLSRHAQRAKDNLSLQLAESTLNAIRYLVSESTLDRDTAVEVYNRIAHNNGWDTIDSINRKYNVTVYYKGSYIGEFTDVEADDEDSAQNDVLENMEVEASLSITLSYGNDSVSDEVDIDPYDLDDNAWTTEVEEA